MRNATDQLNQEIGYLGTRIKCLDTVIEYLIKAEMAGSSSEELLELAVELGETTVKKTKKEKTKENLKKYLGNLEASYIKR